MSKIKILLHSNSAKMLTGFGKNQKNLLLALHEDPEFEVFEAANGLHFGRDAKTPWPCYGTIPTSPEVIQFIGNDPQKQRIASYGFYTIDQIVEEVKPDIFLGIEDIWAFNGFIEHKPWWNKTHKIIWTTLDSLPLFDESFKMAKSCDKFLVWASFAEEEMKRHGFSDVETLHGAIDYSHFKSLHNREDLRKKHGLTDSFVIGFVFKNQLRKSVPNLLDGFKLFKERNPKSNPKLLLHTDWADIAHGWDIPRYIKEKNIDPNDILAPYSCANCGGYLILPYQGHTLDCPICGGKQSLKTKNISHGLSEEQLNEVYNCMDVYCHPFTSGGQELPIQEAKAAGLITLVTEYSCGTDSCYEHQGGLPLAWNEYREPQSQFIKASTCPKSICSQLERVYGMSEQEKFKLTQNGQNLVKQKFSVESVVENLKRIFREVKSRPMKQVDQKIQEQKKLEFSSLLDGERKDRILIVMPESESDIFFVSSILPSIKKLYPEKQIYFATKGQYKSLLLGNPYIYKILEYHPQMENLFLMEGQGTSEGYFEICFLPHIGTQKMIDFLHHGSDKIEFSVRTDAHS